MFYKKVATHTFLLIALITALFIDKAFADPLSKVRQVKTEGGQCLPVTTSITDVNGDTSEALLFDPNQQTLLQSSSTSWGIQSAISQYEYRDLAAHYAPVWYQEVDDSDALADAITNFNYDGNWNALDNWQNIYSHWLYAYVYYSVVETPTHWFITYTVLHPRDWDNTSIVYCAFGDQGACHENDSEGVQLVVKKDGSQYGQIVLLETLSHDTFYVFSTRADVTAASRYVNRVLPLDGNHPKIFIESEGHGIYISTGVTGGDGFSNGNFSDKGFVYRYTGTPEFPENSDDRNIGYELISLKEELWSRRRPPNEMYTHYFQYNGVRFGSGQSIGGTFLGDDYADNRAHPPWSWDDPSDGNVNKGDWAMDPAFAITRHVNIAHDYSLDYLDNFFLTPLGNTITVDQSNASQYFSIRTVGGGIGSNPECGDNGANRWCIENGIPHWSQNLIGCYEISDDNCIWSSCDCQYNSSHSNYITHAWNKNTFPYRSNQIDHIIVRTLTARNVCPGYDGGNDDGWMFNPEVNSMLLSQDNAWTQRKCNSHGLYELTGGFDANSILDAITVRAGDHSDEGAFQILNADIVLKPMCDDGTLVSACNATRQYCSDRLTLENNCTRCGYVCPTGTSCNYSTGICLAPRRRANYVNAP